MSDVFVVPNLNVAYEIVYSVTWSADDCSPIYQDPDLLSWPQNTQFDVNSPENKPALSFFSRFQLKDQKSPEFKSELEQFHLQLIGEKCVGGFKDCLQRNRDMCDDNLDDLCLDHDAIRTEYDGWLRALELVSELEKDKKSLADWFTNIVEKNMLDNLDLGDQSKKQSSSILPPYLAYDAKSLNNGLLLVDEPLENIEGI